MEKKNTKKIIIGVVILIVVIAAMFLVYENFKPKAEAGNKKITVTVVHADKSSKDFEYQTDAEFLGEVITGDGLVVGEDSDYGLFITEVDGEKADDSKQQWWCITKGGEQVNTSADQTPISDGDTFELTLTEGY
ncbi:MAG: DUF4430 domain-containing protein [Lachnospiraceae bacterium]|nr:DUF4430 domain-containing protein [Lachnospiraceae bacterium]MDD3615737.1 DUF4430 domain-containing protein [Lachnospiraceae bacterium]